MPDSRIENQLKVLAGESYPTDPQSNVEEIIQAIIDKTEYTKAPDSRIEAQLIEILNNGGGGSGGIEIETGVWTPETDTVGKATIRFNKTHDAAPAIIFLKTTKLTSIAKHYYAWSYIDYLKLTGNQIYTSTKYWFQVTYSATATSSQNITGNMYRGTYGSNVNRSDDTPYARYWATESEFHPKDTYSDSSTGSSIWGAGWPYKWIAIWLKEPIADS